MEIDTENEEKTVLEADTVYILMKKGFPISRNVRAQWMLEHLNATITVQRRILESEETPELEIVSVLPREPLRGWRVETNHRYRYRITPNTSLIFLAHKYRLVFSLDLSPSLSNVDIQHGEIVIDEIYMATKRCLESITKPFVVPGSDRVMRPEIYVTVIAHTPFFTSPAQQVLVQGWLLNAENIGLLTRFIEEQLNILEERVALVTAIANQQLETLRSESERLVGGLFEEGGTCAGQSASNSITNISMVSPDASFINMLRYGMLALALLPECSCANLVVVSDGIVGVTDVHVLDSIVQQLRASTVACSFLHVGSAYHPHCSNALVPYRDLLEFLATATLGSYVSFLPQSSADTTIMNTYHKIFLCWQLYRTLTVDNSLVQPRPCDWNTTNPYFHGHKPPQLLRKKQVDDKVTCTLSSLLCCRLREGYLIKRVGFRDNHLELCFVLPWKTHIFLEYLISCPWPTKPLPVSNAIHYTITIEAPYEFLHDITCLSKKPLKSQYRQSVVSRFWSALSALTENDDMLSHFSWFSGPGFTWSNVPDTIKSGMPLFYLPTYPSSSLVLLSDPGFAQFGQIWRPVVLLDPSQWARWMHSQRIALILSQDRPLPRHLHLANQSGRFQSIQCRQAAVVLYSMLKNWATFVLIENHTYVQFIYDETDKCPISFSLIRVSCKPPCVVLNIAFAGGTEGIVRHNLVVDLLERISRLTLPNRPTEQRETPCCIILRKPLERILIRYERVPNDLNTVIFPDGTQPVPARCPSVHGGCLTTTLSRYLYHGRWLWAVKRSVLQTTPNIALPRINVTAIARILSTITKVRLIEGFSFAHSAAGIINMVLEVNMEGAVSNVFHPCIIQYVLFPPHVIANPLLERDSGSDADTDEGTGDGEVGMDDSEGSGDFQIVTEVWIEPQYGRTLPSPHRTAGYLDRLQYRQLPDAIARIDEECINALLTLEHLSLLSQMVSGEGNADVPLGSIATPTQGNATSTAKLSRRLSPSDLNQGLPTPSDRIRSVPFNFDVLNILPKCQQAELVFSVFATNGLGEGDRDGANRCLMEGLMDHIKRLHNKELTFTAEDCRRFTELLLKRSQQDRTASTNLRPLDGEQQPAAKSIGWSRASWRCFVKGISVTHVILTILPASEEDLKLLVAANEEHLLLEERPNDSQDLSCHLEGEDNENVTPARLVKSTMTSDPSENSPGMDAASNISSPNETLPSTPRVSDRCASAMETKRALILPIYVYDCPLAVLIDVLVNKLEFPRIKDIFQDHTYRSGEPAIGEDFIALKSGGSDKPSSPEPKSDDSDNVSGDQKTIIEHCKLLNLAYCQCYVVAVYKSLAVQRPLSYQDMEAAVEQCEEALIEINITNYLRSVCRHLSDTSSRNNLVSSLGTMVCSDVQPLHNLIREKFERIMNGAFRPVPTHPEFYFCWPHWNSMTMDRTDLLRSDSEDDLAGLTFRSETLDRDADHANNKVNQLNATWPGASLQDGSKLSSVASTQMLCCNLMGEDSYSQEQPLFLQLGCSVHCRTSLHTVPVKLLPTCIVEIARKLAGEFEFGDAQEVKITLDITCLNLPREVLEVSLERSPGLRTTSFCSASSIPSSRTNSESSPGYETQLSGTDAVQDRIQHLPPRQHIAVSTLVDEIEWLLRDETATALLDQFEPTEHTLNMVAHHVAESAGRPSCSTDKVSLHYVYPAEKCIDKFLEELKKLQVDRYHIKAEGKLFYFVKNENGQDDIQERSEETKNTSRSNFNPDDSVAKDSENNESHESRDGERRISRLDSGDPPGCHSEISSLGEGHTGTDDGYEGDSSNSEDDCRWLVDLDKRRTVMPNFWLILKVESDHVYVYFHCRFLELELPEVDRYRQIQKMVVSQIKAICRYVNQYLLLQSLHDTRVCDVLLEPESSEDCVWRGETGSESGGSHHAHSSIVNTTPGLFRCPVVWEVPFYLHPRFKTGPGKPGLSRGIKALQAVLNRFAVNNRSNMFVYQENNENVFYLRLHEQIKEGKPFQNKLSESDERLVVSRSSSITSLSQTKGLGSSSDALGIGDTRPRVRSFGEKESDVLNKSDDAIVLMVHGITDAGPAVKCDLVQVLQNRLDDAVLEVLSVMLARNPLCKLSPADVHFIQRPYQAPENIIQFLVQPHCLAHMAALACYLRQNLLKFLHNPKYTDPRTNNHFQDYTKDSTKRVPESDTFLYNQSQSSGSRGIACIAVGIVDADGNLSTTIARATDEPAFPYPFGPEHFQEVVFIEQYNHASGVPRPEALVEFRIWKQGRVNLESLTHKLCSAVRHATWDLITEYKLLPTPLTKPMPSSEKEARGSLAHKETQTPTKSKQYNAPASENLTMTRYELGEDGMLCRVYRATLSRWFQFAMQMNVPALKKHHVAMQRRHPVPVIVKELHSLIRANAPDTSTRTFVLARRQPFVQEDLASKKDVHLIKSVQMSESIESIGNISFSPPKFTTFDTDTGCYVPYDLNSDDQSFVDCLLIARNFSQWKASHDTAVEPDTLMPKDHKLLQTFDPLILESTFVPRQRLLLATIQSDNITIYMYNWSKERSEKLTRQITNLGTWLSSRSGLFTNIIMQKMGIFHHQPTQNFSQGDRTPCYHITDMETLTKFPNGSHVDGKDWSRSSARGNHGRAVITSSHHRMSQVLRDAKPSSMSHVTMMDPVIKAAQHFQELKHREKKIKEESKALEEMGQSRVATPNIPISLATLNLFKQHSRLIHYCHTPLLFLPKWRLQSAATRDYSLAHRPSVHTTTLQPAPQESQAKNTNSNVTTPTTIQWHQELCTSMLLEYKQYLQTLGFTPVRVESQKKNGQTSDWQQICYLQKAVLGGVLLFEICLEEPFFIAKVRVIECSRLQTKTSMTLVNQFMLTFIDACDKVKIDMHLHSFTYDFHLRWIHSYIAGKDLWSLREDYHMIHFLDDFNKYYSKAPNYARNLVYSDTVTVGNLSTPARTLYSYLLSNEKICGMQVLEMSRHPHDKESEFVLVTLQSTPLVSYCDAQDMKHTDDFDITLIVSRLEQPAHLERTEITLKYYLMLTSKRELYPKKEVQNNKLGKFRTVYSVARSSTNSHAESSAGSSPVSPIPLLRCQNSMKNESSLDLQEPIAESLASSLADSETKFDTNEVDDSLAPTPPPVPSSLLTHTPSIPNTSAHVAQIRQECVNYLGYYSSHEQLMQQLIMSQAHAATARITTMIKDGAVLCRTHLLWNKLLENRSTMNYGEFTELCSLAQIEPLEKLDPNLTLLINQSLAWFQTLSKVLLNKYQDQHKIFSTADGNVTHVVILHPSYLQAFMMLTINLHTSRGELCAAYRKQSEFANTTFDLDDVYDLVLGFVDVCYFHLLAGSSNK